MSEKTGVSILTVIQVVFLILKLTNLINWSWWWVLAPMWMSLLFAILVIVVVVLILLAAQKNS